MSVHSLSRRGLSLGRLLTVPLAVLVAFGGLLMGSATQCSANASRQHSSVATEAPQQSLTDASSDVSTSRVSAVIEAVPSSRGTAPSGPHCDPVPTQPLGNTSATVRSVRPLDRVAQPQEISVHQDASVAGALPHVLWASSATAHPPQGHLSDSPPAQESMGTLRSVVLRL